MLVAASAVHRSCLAGPRAAQSREAEQIPETYLQKE